MDDLPALGVEDVMMWMPNRSHIHCLVTMRGASASGTFRAIELRQLPEHHALGILTRGRANLSEAEEQAARRIVELLGRLPLALELLSATEQTYQSLLELLLLPLDKGLEPLFEELKNALPTQHASSIVKTFDRSLDLLEGAEEIGTRSKGEAAWTLLRAAALLSPAPLPDVLAEAIHSEMGFPAGWFLAVTTRVRRAAVLQRPVVPERPFSQMHALLARTVVETRISPAQRAALSMAIARAVQRWLVNELTREAGEVDGRIFSSATPLLRMDDSLDSADAAQELGEFAYGLGRWAEALLLHQHAHKVRRHVLGQQDPSTVDALEGLAAARMSQGRLDLARSSLEDVVTLRLAQFERTDRRTLRAIARLAAVLFMLGELQAAREPLEWAWQAWQHVDPGAREALGCASNLALCLQALGQSERARDLHAEAYRRRLQLLPKDDPDTLDSLQHLALIDLSDGNLMSAEARFRTVLAGHRRRSGERCPEALSAMQNLAITWRYRGKLWAACVLLKRTVDGLRSTWGPRHAATLSATHEWAEVLLARGSSGHAVELLEKVYATRREDLSYEHPNTRNSMAALARGYREQGRLDRALAMEAYLLQRLPAKQCNEPP